MKTFRKNTVRILLSAFLFSSFSAYAKREENQEQTKHVQVNPVVTPKHKYVYYPKQNMYYIPARHVYYVWRHDHWQIYSSVPQMYAHLNFASVPYVNLYMTTSYPYYYNVEHRKKYRRYIFATVATSPAVIYQEKPERSPKVQKKPRIQTHVEISFTPVIVSTRPVFIEEHHGYGKGHHHGHGRGHGHHGH